MTCQLSLTAKASCLTTCMGAHIAEQCHLCKTATSYNSPNPVYQMA